MPLPVVDPPHLAKDGLWWTWVAEVVPERGAGPEALSLETRDWQNTNSTPPGNLQFHG